MKRIFFAFIAFCTYYLLAQFGSMFTNIFGFVSPIWPVSGVMLGLYFLYGHPILIGSLLASLLTLQQDPLNATLSSYVIFILASIPVLQFVIAERLVFRYYALPMNTYNSTHIIKFLLLTGPLTVFISCSLFALTLHFLLDISAEKLNYIVLVKYVSDILSIVFITPIFLFLADNIYALKQSMKPKSLKEIVYLFVAEKNQYNHMLFRQEKHK